MVDRLCGDTCSYVCHQTWLNESRTNIGLSPTMGFLNENDCLELFCNFGKIVVRSVFCCGLFEDLKFSLSISWLFQGSKKDIPCSTLLFWLAWEDQISEEKFCWLSALNLKDMPNNGDSCETLDRFMLNMFCPEVHLCSKPLPPLWKKWAQFE